MTDVVLTVKGNVRQRHNREESLRLRTRAYYAKHLVFEKIFEGIWRHQSFYGTYIIENTFIGPIRWRARRNGTLIKDGAVASMEAAKAAVVDDIARRKHAKANTLGSLSSS